MTIDNLKENHSLVMKKSAPRLFRHNSVFDKDREVYSIDLVTVSPIKLEKGYKLKVTLKEMTTYLNPDGTKKEKTKTFNSCYIHRSLFRGIKNFI